MPVTELDIEAAALAIDAAAQDVAAAELMPSGPGTGAYWAGAQGRLRLAVAHHARLVEQRTAEEAAAEQRAATEKSSAKRITAMVKEATESRDKVNAAFAAAQDALVALANAVHERNATVIGHAVELVDLGLALPEGATNQTGATLRGSVRLRGMWWTAVEAATLLNLVVERVKATRLSARDGSEITVGRIAKVARLHNRPDVALEAVPLPANVAPPSPPVLQRAAIEDTPVGIRGDWEREQEIKKREIKWT